MNGPHDHMTSGEAAMPSFSLPPDARGNGLPADRWAEIIVVSAAHAEQLLAAFRAAGVPARMAPSHLATPGAQDTRVWVDPDHFGQAETSCCAR